MTKFNNLHEKRPLLHLVLLEDKTFEKEKNVFYAENAFFANSLIQWCTEKREEESITYEQFKSYMLMLNKFLKKEVDLFWKNGILHVKLLKHHQQGEEDAGDNLESFES